MQRSFQTQHYAHKALQGHPVQMQCTRDDFALPSGLMAYTACRLNPLDKSPGVRPIGTACRLIPLDKSPGVRPIGIGKVVHGIIGKAIMKTAKLDLIMLLALSNCALGRTLAVRLQFMPWLRYSMRMKLTQ